MSKKIDENTITVLENCTEFVDGGVKITQQLDREAYLKVNEVLEALGGKWNRKRKAHLFEGDAREVIDGVLTTGTFERPKDTDFFETPDDVIDIMLDQVDAAFHHRYLEPSAGNGAIVKRLLGLNAKPENIYTVEITHSRAETLRGFGVTVYNVDFLAATTTHIPILFDRIVMNPPFSRQQDILHVEHAYRFLQTGGRLVSVMSAGVLFRENKKTLAFREFVNANGYFKKLPEGSFKTSGTMVNTCLCILEKT